MSSDIECLVNDSSVVFMQFLRSDGRVVVVDKYVVSVRACSFVLCSFVSLVAEWIRRQPNVRPPG